MLERFCEPYLSLFQVSCLLLQPHAPIADIKHTTAQQTDQLFSSPSLTADQHALLLKSILLLLQIFHDLNAQDLPEFFEDRLSQFMTLLMKYLDYVPPANLQVADDDDEEAEAGDLENIKAEVCEIAQLYALRYLDAFGEGGYLGPFVERTWGLLTKLGSSVKYDTVGKGHASMVYTALTPCHPYSSCQRQQGFWASSSKCRRSGLCLKVSKRWRRSVKRLCCQT